MSLDIEVFDSFIDNETYRKLKWMRRKRIFTYPLTSKSTVQI